MIFTFLGSGTSNGIPVIGCDCAVCTSTNPKNKRTRCCGMIEARGKVLVIDTPPDFHRQAVRAGIKRLDAVLYTHAHADHLHGLDDIRSLSYKNPIPIYGNSETLDEIRQRFPYIFNPKQIGGGIPRITFNTLEPRDIASADPDRIDGSILSEFYFADIKITPLAVKHGILDINGYLFEGAKKIAYITDCSKLPDSSLELIKDVDILILGALRYKPHATHFSIDQALEVIKLTSPGKAFLTHLCHDVEHEDIKEKLPMGVFPAFDCLVLK